MAANQVLVLEAVSEEALVVGFLEEVEALGVVVLQAVGNNILND